MAIACSTSAFKTSLDDALGQVAGLGFQHVDLIAIPSWGHVIPADLVADWEIAAQQVEELLKKHGLTPVAMNLAVTHPHQRDDELNAARLAQVEAIARLMKRLGVGVCSFYPGYKVEDRPWEDVLADSAATISEMVAAGKREGVKFAVELHFGTPFQTVEQGMRLLEAVPELGVAYDPSHYAMQQIDLHATRAFLDRAVHVHLRDAGPDKMQVPFGQGTVDIDWIVDTLAERGYDGHLSIEYLPNIEGGPAQNINALKGKLEEKLG
jgi:sugar phosphate isomerase/epimerase